MAEALAEVMTEGAFINGALIGISESRHMSKVLRRAALWTLIKPLLEVAVGLFSGPRHGRDLLFRLCNRTVS